MKKTPKRIAAFAGVGLLASLSVATLLVAIFLPDQPGLLAACITAMIGIPILWWLALYIIGKAKEAKQEGRG